ncbi:MAG: peptide deformylase [Planctomycetes bacterium]|nr:peptide deformylase [Planctomycetota bacterium]
MAQDWSKLTVLTYPDARLRKRCAPAKSFDADLASLAKRMLELMREHRGIGLAAAQVGVNVRLFVMNPTDEPANDKVYVNPELRDLVGGKEDEEGCLSLPEIRVQVRRATRARLVAYDVSGNPVEVEDSDLVARVWQHEIDHLDGVLIIDRMGPSDAIATRKQLKELSAKAKSVAGKKK